MSVIVMVNEKFREGVPPWEVRISNNYPLCVCLTRGKPGCLVVSALNWRMEGSIS